MVISAIKSEFLKVKHSKLNKILLLFILLVASVLTYISAKSVLNTGLNATVETNPDLYWDIPPLDYLAMDNMYPVMMALAVMGAVYGSSEFIDGSIRTSLLSTNNKKTYFWVKFVTVFLISFALSIASSILTNIVTHLALGESGLNPILLSRQVWVYIVYSTISCTLLSMVAYFLAFMTRNSVFSLLFILVQLMDIRRFLPENFPIAKYLPGYLAEELIAAHPDVFSQNPLVSVGLLLVWFVVLAVASYLVFNSASFSQMKGEG